MGFTDTCLSLDMDGTRNAQNFFIVLGYLLFFQFLIQKFPLKLISGQFLLINSK